MILIRGGRVIDPESGFDKVTDVLVDGDRIVKIGNAIKVGPGAKDGGYRPGQSAKTILGSIVEAGLYEQVIDARGMIVAPGLVDVHVHFRDPGQKHKEDIHTGARAAAKGGYTTVVCMANTTPPVDQADTLRYVLSEGKKTGIHVLSAAAITKGLEGRELTDMDALREQGAAGFTDDGIALMDVGLVKEAMERAVELDVPLSLHEEDPALISENGINHGIVSEKLGIYGSPSLAEDALVARDCMIALDTGATVNIQHISSGYALEAVRLAKKLGADVWAEVTPHHFSLTEEAVLEHGSLAKMNPPLRTEYDRKLLIEGLKDGTIDVIATDHAPHSTQEKEKPLVQAPSGIIGLETALALAITHLVIPGHLTIAELLEKMSLNPARLYRLDCGRVKEGGPADLVVFSDKETWTVEGFESKSSNSPFVGQTLTGKVKCTVCGGKVVYQD